MISSYFDPASALFVGLLFAIGVGLLYQSIPQLNDNLARGVALLLGGWALVMLSVWAFFSLVLGWHLWPLASLNSRSENVSVEAVVISELPRRTAACICG